MGTARNRSRLLYFWLSQGGTMQFTLDPTLAENTLVDWRRHQRSSNLDRRHLLKLGFATVIAASLPSRQLHAQAAPETCAPPIRKNMHPPTADHAHIRSLGSTRMVITTKARRRMLSYPTSFTSKESWPDATASMEWVRTIKGTALPGEIPPPTIATWQANTGQGDKRGREYSPIPD